MSKIDDQNAMIDRINRKNELGEGDCVIREDTHPRSTRIGGMMNES
jgi:hypothetical protein